MNLNEMIADLETRAARLAALEAANADANDYVVKCGPLCIEVVDDNGERADPCGVERATRFASPVAARRIAERVSNGAGERGTVVMYVEALGGEIDHLAATLGALRAAAK